MMRSQTKNGPAGRSALASAVVAATLSFALVTAGPANTSELRALPPDLSRALDAYNQATMHNDTTTLSGLVTDDYMLVNSDSSIQGKTSYLADFAVPGFKMDPYEVKDLVYKVGRDAALTTGVFQLGWTQDGRHQSRRLRIAHFWVSQEGRWRIAYTQLTRLPE